MSDHDPLCPYAYRPDNLAGTSICQCRLIGYVRASERERIANGLWPLVEPITTWIARVTQQGGPDRDSS